jgi:hypothetical protein
MEEPTLIIQTKFVFEDSETRMALKSDKSFLFPAFATLEPLTTVYPTAIRRVKSSKDHYRRVRFQNPHTTSDRIHHSGDKFKPSKIFYMLIEHKLCKLSLIRGHNGATNSFNFRYIPRHINESRAFPIITDLQREF